MERYVATQFYKADSPESRILRESGIAPSEFVLAADAQATIATLQARLESANKLIHKKNCDLGRAEAIVNDLQAELERVRDLIKALPKVEGEIEYVSGMGWIIKHNGDVRAIPDLGRGLVAALLQHRQGMEGV